MIEPIDHRAYIHLQRVIHWDLSLEDEQPVNVKLFCTQKIKSNLEFQEI